MAVQRIFVHKLFNQVFYIVIDFMRFYDKAKLYLFIICIGYDSSFMAVKVSVHVCTGVSIFWHPCWVSHCVEGISVDNKLSVCGIGYKALRP